MRWDEQRVEAERERPLPGLAVDAIRTFDVPEALGIRFHEVRAKSALNHVPGAPYGFNWTINLFRGCTHACTYCFARRTHRYLDLDAGRDFEREIIVKVNAPEILRAELARPSWRRELVAIGTNTDPYQWVESRYRMMPEVLEALHEAETPVSVLTKSPLVLRDIDQYVEMAKAAGASVNLSVPTLDEKVWRATEPHTPHPRARLEAVAEFNRQGVSSGVLVAPLMPGINDAPEQVEPIVEIAREAGASFVGSAALHLRDEVRDVFFGWLEAKRPDLLPRYEQLYARGAYLPSKERQRLSDLVKGWGRSRRRSPAGGAGGGDPARAAARGARPEESAGPDREARTRGVAAGDRTRGQAPQGTLF
jgi:DNA repair photolyase